MTHFADYGDPAWLTATDIGLERLDEEIAHQILEVAEVFGGIGFVAGGAARYLMIPDAPVPSDIDVFMFGPFINVEPLYEAGYSLVGGPERAPFFMAWEEGLRVQAVRPDGEDKRVSFGTPLEVLSGFTFHTEQAAIWHGTGGAAGLLSVRGRESTVDRVLTNNQISNPLLSMYRLNKYGQKGYAVSMETVMEIAVVLSRLSDEEFQAAVVDATSMHS